MFFSLLIAILLTLAGSESHTLVESPLRSLGELLVLAVAIAFAPYCAGSLLLERIRATRYDLANRRLLRFYRLAAPIWIAVLAPAVVYVTKWPMATRQLIGDGWLLDEVLMLAPVLLSFALIWWVVAGIERQLMILRDGWAPNRKALFGLQLRHFGGFLLAPVFFALAIGEFADRFESQLRGREWILAVIMVLGLVLLFPFVLRRIWATQPLPPGQLRDRLELTARRVGMRVREILVWRTHGCVVNAAVVGFSGLARYLLLTDELLAQFNDEEVESVLLHEAAHVRRRHLLLRLGLIGFPLIAIALATAGAQSTGSVDYASLLPPADPLAGDGAWWTTAWSIITPVLMLAYLGVSLGWISRLLEFDADVWACRFMSASRGMSLTHASERYIGMLKRLAVVAGTPLERRSWLHPSIGERIALLSSLAEYDEPTRVLEQQLRATIIVYLLLGAAPVALACWFAL